MCQLGSLVQVGSSRQPKGKDELLCITDHPYGIQLRSVLEQPFKNVKSFPLTAKKLAEGNLNVDLVDDDKTGGQAFH